MRLSIQVRLDGLSFFTQDFDSKAVVHYESISFDRRVDAAGLLPEIETIFKNNDHLQGSFKNVAVLYINALFTLVPKALFKEDSLTDYLKFNTKILRTDFVTYDTIEYQDMVNVYVPYANVNNFFFEKFGAFDYYHGISKFIEQIGNQSNVSARGDVHINVHPSSFEMAAIQNRKLLLANVFQHKTTEDFIYYILFTIAQLELDPERVTVYLTGHIDKEDAKYHALYTYVRHVHIAKSAETKIATTDYLLTTLV